jgi:hypothetical protein
MSLIESDVVKAEAYGSHSTVKAYWEAILAGEFEQGLPLNNHTTALANSLVVKSGAGMLFGISGFNNKVSAQFIQIFDTQTVPSNGAVPDVILTAPTVANFSMDWVFPGRFFRQGIVIVNSSTAATLTIGSADCWFDAQYI